MHLFRPLRLAIQIVATIAAAAGATAGDQMMERGRSPDGDYEIRIAADDRKDASDGYEIHLYSVPRQERLFTLSEIGGYLKFATAVERDCAYWHGTSRFVAITDQGTRHTRELYVVAIADGKPFTLAQPDFVQNALGRVDAIAVDFACVITPLKWEDDDLFLNLYFTANQRRSYTFEVVLHLHHAPQTTPRLALKGVRKLKEQEG